MSEQARVSHPKEPPLSTDVEGFGSLAELALDMRSSWNHATDQLWRQLDPLLWDLTHNPWVVLQTVSRETLQRDLANPAFRNNIDDLVQARRDAAEVPAWFQQTYPQSPLSCVAYFSMEFMLGEALPIYSGGLGNVAGDQLKAAGDLGVPVIGVGLLYQQGYFRQVIDQSATGPLPLQRSRTVADHSIAAPKRGGCGCSSTCRGTRSGFAPGKFRSAERSFTCWTAMMRQTFHRTGGLPVSFTAAGRTCA